MQVFSPTNQNAAERDDEGQGVSSQRFLILAVAFSENVQVREETVFAKSLEHLGGGDETGQRRTQSGREAAGVVQRSEGGNQFHDLVTVVQTPLARLVQTKVHVIRDSAVDVVGYVASGLSQDGSAGDGGENDIRNGGDGHGQKCSFRNGMRRVLILNQIRFKNNWNNKIIQIKIR